MKTCTNCSAENADEAKFCSGCGSSIMTPLSAFLHEHGLAALHSVFQQNDLSSLVELRALTDGDLSEMDISIGDKVRLKKALKNTSGEKAYQFELVRLDEAGHDVDNATLDNLKLWLKRERDEPYGMWCIQKRKSFGITERLYLFERMLNWGTSDDGISMQQYIHSSRENSMVEIENAFIKFYNGDESWKTDLSWEKGDMVTVSDDECYVDDSEELDDEE